jgi:hypothetical protein
MKIDTIWLVVGAIATPFVGAVITRFVAWLFERSSRLIVRVVVNERFSSPKAYAEVEAMLRKVGAGGGWELLGPWYKYFSSNVYHHVSVKNNSTKTLKDLSICLHHPFDGLLQIADGSLIDLKFDVPVSLGNLQPRRSLELHVLTPTPVGFDPRGVKRSLTFSAEELGRVAYKFPLSSIHKRRWVEWLTIMLTIGLVMITVAALSGKLMGWWS